LIYHKLIQSDPLCTDPGDSPAGPIRPYITETEREKKGASKAFKQTQLSFECFLLCRTTTHCTNLCTCDAPNGSLIKRKHAEAETMLYMPIIPVYCMHTSAFISSRILFPLRHLNNNVIYQIRRSYCWFYILEHLLDRLAFAVI
jgi:hypothetical protein